jgi:hypothetical protein
MRSGGGAVPFKQMGSTPSPLKSDPATPAAATNNEDGTTHDARIQRRLAQGRWETGSENATKQTGKSLNELVSARKGLEKGSDEYNKVQNQINTALGNEKRHDVKPTPKAKPQEKATPQQVTSTKRPDGGYNSTVSYAKGKGKTVNKDRPYDAAIDSKSTPKAEPTKKEARVAKRTERKEDRAERKDTKRQAKDMKKVNKLVAKDDKRKAKDLKRNFKNNPYDAAVSNAKTTRLGGTEERY